MIVTRAFKRFMAPPVFEGDELKTRRARLLTLIINAGLAGLPVITLANLIGGHIPAFVIGLDVLFIGVYLVTRQTLHRGQVDLAGTGLMIAASVVITAADAGLGTIRTPTTAAYFVLVVAAGLMYDRRGLALTVGVSSLEILGLIVAENAGWLPRPDLTVTITQWVSLTAYLTLGGGLTYYALIEIRQALHRADLELAERKRAEAALRRQNDTLSSLHQVTLDILKHRAVDELLEALVVSATDLLDAPYGELSLLEGDEFVVRAVSPRHRNLLGDRARRDEARLSWQAVTTGQPAVLTDYGSWPHHRAIYDPAALHAVVSFPILIGARCLGVLGLGRDRPDYAFDADQIQTGQLFARLAALALDNAQLFAAAQSELAERQQAEASLREANAELHIRNEELDAFAHTVAHDLKGSIGLMVGFADMLLESYPDLSSEAIQGALLKITGSGIKAANIVESLLLLSGIRRQEVQPERIEMSRVIDEAVQRLAEAIKTSGAVISQPDRADWPIVRGYAPWVEEIWVNYLSNAIKYGGQAPCIELGATRQPDGFIRFTVRDYGAGLTLEQQQRLFAPFERLGQAHIKGQGLGLSIVRRIADKLGGQVGVDSQPGQGSTFYFTLPAVAAASFIPENK
ncbi:MAG: GAF domain-containing protein [Chloroflexi bacterium]|nr:GAF domain-containing protein [Chloroflexota bacterium]